IAKIEVEEWNDESGAKTDHRRGKDQLEMKSPVDLEDLPDLLERVRECFGATRCVRRRALLHREKGKGRKQGHRGSREKAPAKREPFVHREVLEQVRESAA